MDEKTRAVLKRLEAEDQRDRTDGTPRERRLRAVTPEVGRFLNVIAKISGAKRLLEVGGSCGYSTLWLADAARTTGGRITSLEIDAAKVERATRNLAEAGLGDLVTIVEGDARTTLEKLDPGFDLAFLDAEKELYLELLGPIVRALRPGGVLIADNLLSHAEDLAGFRRAAEAHPDLECVLVPIPRGELLCRKKG